MDPTASKFTLCNETYCGSPLNLLRVRHGKGKEPDDHVSVIETLNYAHDIANEPNTRQARDRLTLWKWETEKRVDNALATPLTKVPLSSTKASTPSCPETRCIPHAPSTPGSCSNGPHATSQDPLHPKVPTIKLPSRIPDPVRSRLNSSEDDSPELQPSEEQPTAGKSLAACAMGKLGFDLTASLASIDQWAEDCGDDDDDESALCWAQQQQQQQQQQRQAPFEPGSTPGSRARDRRQQRQVS